MTTRTDGRSRVAARLPVIRGIASFFVLFQALAIVAGGIGIVLVLLRPVPVAETVLWMIFLAGSSASLFLFGWYFSQLGFAVAELGERAEVHPTAAEAFPTGT